MISLEQFKLFIGIFLGINPLHISLFWKGRVALYAILKSLNIQPGDEVVVQGYTCVVVPNAIKYLGAKPIYVDINQYDFSLDIELLSKAISKKTRAIIVQNTLGMAPRLEETLKIAKENGLFVIEDCAHGFGGKNELGLNGLQSDAAFFSTQWNKVFSTCIGGIAVSKNPKLAQQISDIENTYKFPSFFEEMSLLGLSIAKGTILTPKNYLIIQDWFRWLSQHNFVIGSSKNEELESPIFPAHFLQRMGVIQSLLGCREMKKLPQNLIHRLKVADFYKNILQNEDFPFIPEHRNNLFLRYPLFVKNPQQLFNKARKEGIELGDWLISPIHPILEHFEKWDYIPGTCPHAEWVSNHIINLPTHSGIDRQAMQSIHAFLRSTRREFIPALS